MDPSSFTKTSFCDKEIDNITTNEDKQYILQLLKLRTNGQTYNSRYAKIYNEQYSKNLSNPHILCLKSSGTPYLLFLTQINDINYCFLIDKKIRKYSRGANYTIYKMIDEGSIKPKVNYSYVADYIRSGLPKICFNTNTKKIRQTKRSFQPSDFQKSQRDFAFVIDKIFKIGLLEKIIKEIDYSLIQEVTTFDVYEGDNIPKDKKSVAINVTLQSPNKTLSEKDLDQISKKIIDIVKEKTGAIIRS